MEFKQYLKIIRKWLWLIVSGTLLAAGVSYGVSSLLPPTYRASTSLLVRTSAAGGDDYGTVIVNQYLAATYNELLTKRPIIETAGLNLGLPPSTIGDLMTRVEAWVVPNTSLIRLTVDDRDPRLAMELANEIVSVFVQAQRESGQGHGRDIFVVEPARQPLKPVAPRELLNTLVAVVGGCTLATGIAFLIEYLDDTLGSSEDIERWLSMPALVTIPGNGCCHKPDESSLALSDPASSVTESYRALYARIQFSNGDGSAVLGTMLVTSPSTRKERANIAINLGYVIAQTGLKVLLVDADPREPTLHRVFGLTNEIGMTSLLLEDQVCQKCTAKTDISNLYVLPSGPPRSATSALMSSHRMVQLIEELKGRFDVVLFAAPPVLMFADAMFLAPQMDGTILVVESRFSRRKTTTQAVERLRSVGASLLGVVLNNAPYLRYGRLRSKRAL
jgi:capsular exopolysaccharide synthesis family protein